MNVQAPMPWICYWIILNICYSFNKCKLDDIIYLFIKFRHYKMSITIFHNSHIIFKCNIVTRLLNIFEYSFFLILLNLHSALSLEVANPATIITNNFSLAVLSYVTFLFTIKAHSRIKSNIIAWNRRTRIFNNFITF